MKVGSLVSCPAHTGPTCQTCGGSGKMRVRCWACGSPLHGPGVGAVNEYVACLENALRTMRKAFPAFTLEQEEAAHRAYVAFGELMATHRTTPDAPVKFVDAWKRNGPHPAVPEVVREAWRAAVKAARGG